MSKAKMENVKWVNKMALPALAGTVVETIFSIADQAIIGAYLKNLRHVKICFFASTIALIISAISCGTAYVNIIFLELGLKGVYIGLGLSYVMLGMGYYIKYRRTVIGEELEM